MPPLDVRMNAASRSLGNEEVVFVAGEEGQLLGTLTVSTRFIEWFCKPRLSGRRMSWEEFADIMEESGREEAVRRDTKD